MSTVTRGKSKLMPCGLYSDYSEKRTSTLTVPWEGDKSFRRPVLRSRGPDRPASDQYKIMLKMRCLERQGSSGLWHTLRADAEGDTHLLRGSEYIPEGIGSSPSPSGVPVCRLLTWSSLNDSNREEKHFTYLSLSLLCRYYNFILYAVRASVCQYHKRNLESLASPSYRMVMA